jgi:hypothetical protein
MSRRRGLCVVDWLERWGACFLRSPQPHVYQQFLLHVGGTDVLRRYVGQPDYWRHVQSILDGFFTMAERAQMCAELISQPLFDGEPGFQPFLAQAKAEIRCAELIEKIEAELPMREGLRSVG